MIERLAEGSYAVRNAERLRSNSGFIVSEESVFVVDTLMTPRLAKELREEIAKRARASVNAVINTHFHGDHVFGNSEFAPPAVVIAHSDTRSVLATAGQGYVETFIEHYHQNRPTVAAEIRKCVVTSPTCTFDDEMTLYADDLEVRLLHVGPAHTYGDIVVYIPSNGVLFAGDVVFNRIHPYFLEATLEGSIAALKRLGTMSVSKVVPGHGDVADASVLDVMLEYFVELRDRVLESVRRGADVERTIEIVLSSLRPDWPARERLSTTVRRAYAEVLS